ncbi:MAG: beta-lactamase family protein, partial [Desulfobacterales bacterium]|nr:beta-lactamase family protein [Desulfobacterales bacterium]
MRHICLVLILCLVCICQVAVAGERNRTLIPEKYDAYLNTLVQEGTGPGLAAAVILDGKLVLLKGYGTRRMGSGRPVTPDTLFRIGSVSKGFASVLTALLVEDGSLDWSDPVPEYLPGFSLGKKSWDRNLTIANVLSHRSGLVPHAYDNLIDAGVPLASVFPKLKHTPRVCPVGTCYGYQNTVYSLMDSVIESATGRPYAQAMATRLFKP